MEEPWFFFPALFPAFAVKKSARDSRNSHHFDHATWQHAREIPRHVRGAARIYDVRMAQFVLKIEKLSHIMGPRGSQDLRSPSPIMAPGTRYYRVTTEFCSLRSTSNSRQSPGWNAWASNHKIDQNVVWFGCIAFKMKIIQFGLSREN